MAMRGIDPEQLDDPEYCNLDFNKYAEFDMPVAAGDIREGENL